MASSSGLSILFVYFQSFCLFNLVKRYVDLICTECGYPGLPENGLVATPGGFGFGQIANYSCELGYRLVGTVRRHCTSQGWNGTLPYCSALGKLGGELGYRLVDVVERHCTSQGWNNPAILYCYR